MCLSVLGNQKELAKVQWQTFGYKVVFENKDDSWTFPYGAIKGTAIIPRGKWLQADKPKIKLAALRP